MRLGLTLILLFTASAFAADPPGFTIWKAEDLAQRDEALAGKLLPDHSARETLGEYPHHRVRLIYRVGESEPELHDKIVDIWVVQSGEGTLVVGGELVDRKPGQGDGEWRGSRIQGGERHAIRAGDIVHIPVGMPHGVIVPAGKHITYVNLRLNSAEAMGFHLWPAAELKQLAATLGPKIPQGQSYVGEELATYRDHLIRATHLVGNGNAEMHEKRGDFYIIESGEGTLVVGGRIVNSKVRGPGESFGPAIEGGEKHALAAGDVVHIPPETPHQNLITPGNTLTYIVVYLPEP